MSSRSEKAANGRGISANPEGRYETLRTERLDDGWTGDDNENRVATTVLPERSKTIITRNQSPDVPFDQSINPYKGCEHGCTYCFARPTHAFLGLSPGLDFETKLFSKPDAAALLRAELNKKGYRPSTIALGANTDPYQPIERNLCITRQVLEVLDESRHPASIVTKSALVLRDVDILRRMAERRQISVYLSVTTLDAGLQRTMEPRAAAPAKRLEVINELTQAGIPVGVLASPMIPALNDSELEEILTQAAKAGATCASYLLLRLPLELSELFADWLGKTYPDRAQHILSLVRQAHEGQLYRSDFGVRMKGSGAYAEVLEQRFGLALKRLGLLRRRPDAPTDSFRPPMRHRDGQMQLFE